MNNVRAKSRVFAAQGIILLISGIIFSLIALEIGLRLGGLIFLSRQEHPNGIFGHRDGNYLILCLGESTTAGGKDSYPAQLEKILNQHSQKTKFSVINKGLPSINSTYLVTHLENNLEKYRPDMVITMMGINDNRIKYYEDIPEADTFAFNKLRIYRLARLIARDISKIYRIAHKKPVKGALYYVLAGDIYMKQEDFPQAESMFKKAAEFDPLDYHAFVRLGNCYAEQKKFSPAEEMFKKAIGINPSSDEAYVGLERYYRSQHRYDLVDKMFKQATGLNPYNAQAFIELGESYEEKGEFIKALAAFKKAVELDDKNSKAYVRLAECLEEQEEFSQAIALFQKAMELEPDNAGICVKLGEVYAELDDSSAAERVFKKALELSPHNAAAYIRLGGLYTEQGRVSFAEEMFKKAVEFNPKNIEARLELADFYRQTGNNVHSEEMYKKFLELDPYNYKAYVGLGYVYLGRKDYGQSEAMFKKAGELRTNLFDDKAFSGLAMLYMEKWGAGSKEYKDLLHSGVRLRDGELNNPVTGANYLKLKAILDKRGIKLVCVQYPLRSVGLLKEIFKDESAVILVDNEKNFKEALKKSSTTEYFEDMFAGDFGHCTREGNRLIAQNIADVILKEDFFKR
ncbi:MAG: tetratricopeptide repeat protein [Candidatus Omnitrophica bacterium]|nr:tetratricopeptide repeat protein [Candidatus Omnitrophota bacterium]